MTVDQQLATKVARAELVKRVLIVATAVLVTVVLGVLLLVVGLIRDTQQEGSPTLKAISAQQDDIERGTNAAVAVQEQVLDCLDPAGKCYQRSQQQSANTVASINEITYYAAVCADQTGAQSLAALRACVAELLTAARPQD